MKFYFILKIQNLTLFAVFFAVYSFLPVVYAQSVSVKVLTYNIRYANPGDAPNTWQNRKEKVFSLIRKETPDVFGVQEALMEQVADLEHAFPQYSRVGVGRDDGKEAGEFSPLFYDSGKFRLISSGVFWLSQTPQIAGSRGWDAACNRLVTWIKLSEKKSGFSYLVFCTHFDHMGELARRNSAQLLIHSVDSLSVDLPAIVMGDFNANLESEPYKLITEKANAFHLTDARSICTNVKGPEYTYTGFSVGGIKGEMIDYIFLKGFRKVKSFTVDPANNGEFYPSDHLPVSAVIESD